MRVNKANQAGRIESMIRQFHLYSDAEEILDRVFYHFSRLHRIGVTVDENDCRNRYVFMKYPYEESESWNPLDGRSHEGSCLMDAFTFVKPCTTKGIKRENIMYILSHVERQLNLPHWESYLEEEREKNHHDELDAMTFMMAPRACGKSNQMFQKSLEYIRTDVESIRKMDANLAKSLLNSRFGLKNTMINWNIKKVIFHDPATIIYWNDGTKTVVKVQNGEKFDPEKGMAMAICKKANCNDSSYYEAFKEFLPEEEKLPSGVLNFMECLTVFAAIQNLEIVGPQPETGVIRIIDKRNSDKHYHLVVERDTIPEEKWQELRDSMLNYFKKSPITGLPKDLEESTDEVTIDTEAEQYTGEAPKEASDCKININTALVAFAEDVGCLEILYYPEHSIYRVWNKGRMEIVPYEIYVESPAEEISLTALAQLKLDICKHFDI